MFLHVYVHYTWQLVVILWESSVKLPGALNLQTLIVCSQGKYRVRLLRASGHQLLVRKPIHDLILCVFLFKDALFNIYGGLTNAELAARAP